MPHWKTPEFAGIALVSTALCLSAFQADAALIAMASIVTFARRSGPQQGRAGGSNDTEFLLGRRVGLSGDSEPSSFSGKTILVTGAGGTIGSEICRQVIGAGAARLVAIDHSEYALFQLEQNLRRVPGGRTEIRATLGSIANPAIVRQLFDRQKVDIIFHAAAYKHVHFAEQCAVPALVNNVLATRILAESAITAKAPKFVLISTDKAANPTGVMGASKRMAEAVIQDLALRSDRTEFSIVRFGNVFGSSGSLVPRVRDQIARGGPVLLTDPAATRYFVTLDEAARFALHAAQPGTQGAVLTLRMGRPVVIRDLISRMILLSGHREQSPSGEEAGIKVLVSGLLPGENLHEHPTMDGVVEETDVDRVLRIRVPTFSEIEIAQLLRDISDLAQTQDSVRARGLVAYWQEKMVAGRDTPLRASPRSARAAN